MERYIIFIRNKRTNEEFISTRRDYAGRHDEVMFQESKKYPASEYIIHTAYMERELKDILETLHRWTGIEGTDPQPVHNIELVE